MTANTWLRGILPLALLVLAGCGASPTTSTDTKGEAEKAVLAERAKLGAEERALVDAQEWCVVESSERLGSMGRPVKLDVRGQAVFLCCAGCERRALADPDKTLAKLHELREKAAARKAAKAHEKERE